MRVVLLVCCLSASMAHAQDRIAEAREAFEEGSAAFSRGQFAVALDRFARAYELAPRSELLYNIATAHDRLGHAEDALRYYRDYLEATPDAQNRDYTESRIGVLEEQIAAAADEPEEDPVQVAVPVEPESSANIGAITLIAVGGASAIAAAITGGLALSQRGDLDDACPMGDCGPDRRDDLNRLDRLTISTDVMIGIAAATAVTGVIWLLVGGDDDDDVALDASGVRVRF